MKTTQKDTNDTTDKPKQKRTRNILLAIIAVLVIIILLILFQAIRINMLTVGVDTMGNPVIGTLDIDGYKDNKGLTNDELQKQVNDAVEAGYFQCTMNSDITIRQGKANVFIQNSQGNLYNTVVELRIDKQLIYTSKLIEPGYKVEYDTIDVGLADGQYDGTATLIAYNQDKAEVNRVNLQVKLTVHH